MASSKELDWLYKRHDSARIDLSIRSRQYRQARTLLRNIQTEIATQKDRLKNES